MDKELNNVNIPKITPINDNIKTIKKKYPIPKYKNLSEGYKQNLDIPSPNYWQNKDDEKENRIQRNLENCYKSIGEFIKKRLIEVKRVSEYNKVMNYLLKEINLYKDDCSNIKSISKLIDKIKKNILITKDPSKKQKLEDYLPTSQNEYNQLSYQIADKIIKNYMMNITSSQKIILDKNIEEDEKREFYKLIKGKIEFTNDNLINKNKIIKYFYERVTTKYYLLYLNEQEKNAHIPESERLSENEIINKIANQVLEDYKKSSKMPNIFKKYSTPTSFNIGGKRNTKKSIKKSIKKIIKKNNKKSKKNKISK